MDTTPTYPTLHAVTACALAAYPAEEARIRRGAEIVARGGVRIPEHGAARVGIYHWYPVTDTCPCPDAALGNAPSGRCKHRYALTFSRKMALPLRSVLYYASLGDADAQRHGVATIWEDGTVVFTEHDSDVAQTTTLEQIVLGARKEAVDAYRLVLDRRLATCLGRDGKPL